MTDPGLTLTGQAPAEADVRLRDPALTPSGLWRQLWDGGLAPHVVTATRATAFGRTHDEFAAALDEAGVTALSVGHEYDGTRSSVYQRAARWLTLRAESDDGTGDELFWKGMRVTRSLGSGGKVMGVPSTTDDIHNGPLALLRMADAVPTVVIHLDTALFEAASDEDGFVQFLTALANSLDVHLVAGRLTRAKLWDRHRHRLPSSVSDPANPHQTDGSRVDAATLVAADDTLGRDSRQVAILREIARSDSETLSYHALEASQEVSRSRISQILTADEGSLEELGLVATFGKRGDRHVELTPGGRAFLDALDEEIARQRELDEFVQSDSESVSDDLHPAEHGRDSLRARGEGVAQEPDPRRKGDGLATVDTLARRDAVGAGAAAPDGGVAVLDHSTERIDDYRKPGVFYDPRTDTLTVSAEFVSPMQYWVSIARALASPYVFDRVLTDDRLTDPDHDFAELLAEYREVLWGKRCLGYLDNDDVDDADDYRTALQDARDGLEDLTRKLNNGDYDDEELFRGTILKDAHGLVGTLTHLLDLVDVDLVREVRIPDFARDFDEDRQDALVRTLATGATIAAEYDGYVARRQLFESRTDKVDGAIMVDPDAADPHGDLIGSFVLKGRFNSKQGEFADRLRERLNDPETLRDDAPEFTVPIPVRTACSRRQYAQALEGMCETKNLRPTREAVSVACLLAGTPYAVADAIHWLGSEAYPRDIRLDELRYALGKLGQQEPDRLVPHESTATQEIVAALLTADQRLSPSELAERAGVAASTVHRKHDRLSALGLLDATDDAYRIQLPFHTTAGRRDEPDRLPWFLADQTDGDTVLVRDVCYRLAEAAVDDPARWGDPDDPICGVWLDTADGVPDLARLLTEWPWLDAWIDTLEAVLDEPAAIDRSYPVATMGPRIEQTSITAENYTASESPSAAD
jgi:DNA-binding MarR family transcriptional regulator